MKVRSRPVKAASNDDTEAKATTSSVGLSHLELEQSRLSVRISPALVELGLCREITWTEAARVLDGVEYYDEREAARWRRQEQLIAEYQARQSA